MQSLNWKNRHHAPSTTDNKPAQRDDDSNTSSSIATPTPPTNLPREDGLKYTQASSGCSNVDGTATTGDYFGGVLIPDGVDIAPYIEVLVAFWGGRISVTLPYNGRNSISPKSMITIDLGLFSSFAFTFT